MATGMPARAGALHHRDQRRLIHRRQHDAGQTCWLIMESTISIWRLESISRVGAFHCDLETVLARRL